MHTFDERINWGWGIFVICFVVAAAFCDGSIRYDKKMPKKIDVGCVQLRMAVAALLLCCL